MLAVIQELLELGRDLDEAGGAVGLVHADALFALAERSLECRPRKTQLGVLAVGLRLQQTIVAPGVACSWDAGLGLSSGDGRGGLFEERRGQGEDLVDHEDLVRQPESLRVHVEEAIDRIISEGGIGQRRVVAVDVGVPCVGEGCW